VSEGPAPAPELPDMNAIGAPSVGDRVYARRWWTLGVLSLSLVLIGLDNTILNVALPTIQQTFNATASDLQWMVDAYVLVFAGLLLTMGALGDKFGRARGLQIGLVVFAVSSLGASFATEVSHLIVARVAMGVGGALIMPSTLSVIANVFPREERAKAITIWAGVSGLGVGLGPLVGGLLIENFSWSSVFLVNVPIALVALVLGIVLVPESRDPSGARLDLPGAVLSIGAVSALVYGIIEAPAVGWTNPRDVRPRDRAGRGVCLARDPHIGTDARSRAFPQRAFYGRRGRHRPHVLRDVRRHLRPDPVPPVRSR